MDTALRADISELNGYHDLKTLLHSPAPCISIYLPLNAASAQADALAWREALAQLQQPLQEYGSDGQQLLRSFPDWHALGMHPQPHGQSLAAFRSSQSFHVVPLSYPVAARTSVGPRFYIRPLLPELAKPVVFYILALSQKDVRLLRATAHDAASVPLPPHVATSFAEFMNVARTDTVHENKDEFLAHFFRQIDRGLNELLRDTAAPVVLAGVHGEVAQYRSLTAYPHLSEEEVQGAPNSLKAGELHARALEALDRAAARQVDAVLAEYNHKAGGGASNHLKDIVTAAQEGRVLKLLVSDSLETPSEHGDLLNEAAIDTILHAGEVFSLSNKQMPNGAPAAAIFRY